VDALDELRANTTAPNVYYLIGSADVLPLMDASVDVVITRSVIDDKPEAARELVRVLSSGGRISMYGDPDCDLEELFSSAGFSDVRTDAADLYLSAVKP
jgi:ubiquinone/menaquinone biosynthesis C-methylase UbiE